MSIANRVKFSFVHGITFGFELFEYKALKLPDNFDPDNEEELEKFLANPSDDIIQNRSGLLVHFGPFKMLVI